MESITITPPVDFATLREAYFRHTQAELNAGGFHIDHSVQGNVAAARGGMPADADATNPLPVNLHVNLHDQWHAAREMLTNWGFDLRHVEKLPIGFFGSAETLGHRLLQDGFSADDIRASNLLADTRLPGRLVGPIRDRNGHIVSFWARTIGGGSRSLYLSGNWKVVTAVVGLDTATKSSGGGQELLLVEDVLDALLLQSRGMPSVVAVGSAASDMTADRWKRLAELDVLRVTLLLESFRSPESAAVAAIEHAAAAAASPALYVLLGADDDGAQTARDSIGGLGYEATSELLGRPRLHGFHYCALQIIAAHRPDKQWTDSSRRAALRAAQTFYNAAHPRNVPALDTFFLPPLLDALGLDWAAPQGRWEDRIGNNGTASVEKGPTEKSPQKVPENVPEKASGEPAKRRVWLSRTSGYCHLHNCQRNDCLCWD